MNPYEEFMMASGIIFWWIIILSLIWFVATRIKKWIEFILNLDYRLLKLEKKLKKK